MELSEIKALCQICCPFDLLVEEYLPKITGQRINPEIGLNGGILDRFNDTDFKGVARVLKEHGLYCTVHAPFVDLSIGAIDKMVRKATVERLKRSLDIAMMFNAEAMVCHTGFDPRHHRSLESQWTENALESLSILLEHTENIPLSLENVFETSPDIHRHLFENMNSRLLGFCLDLGHLYAFGNGDLEGWFNQLKLWLMQLHLHDNNHKHDEHLPIGHGSLDFRSLFGLLYREGAKPLITLEPHREEDVIPSLEGLGRLLDLYPIMRRF